MQRKDIYSTWRRERRGKGGGVMILVEEDIVVEEVECGDAMAETSVVIKIKGNEKRKIIVT